MFCLCVYLCASVCLWLCVFYCCCYPWGHVARLEPKKQHEPNEHARHWTPEIPKNSGHFWGNTFGGEALAAKGPFNSTQNNGHFWGNTFGGEVLATKVKQLQNLFYKPIDNLAFARFSKSTKFTSPEMNLQNLFQGSKDIGEFLFQRYWSNPFSRILNKSFLKDIEQILFQGY